MSIFNVYLTGVGGQGIGLLSGALGAAIVDAGHKLLGCETHGLAQRGGVVVSHLRVGEGAYAPRVPPGQADLVVSLERLEGLRGAVNMLRPGGRIIYYDAEYQPIAVRMGEATYPKTSDIEAEVASKGGTLERVFDEDLSDPRMQNVALLARVAALGAIDKITPDRLEKAIADSVPAKLLDTNLEVYRRNLADLF
jgi:indolepyruvate ferredoxin oxidoreductase, beta subunit